MCDAANGPIFIVRHAESEANAGGITTGPSTIALTATGERQSQHLAEAIPVRPALIVVSRFLRSVQTAAPLLQRYPGVPVECWPVEEFTYLNLTASHGTTYAERQTLRDVYWGRRDPRWVDGPGCESFDCLLTRVRSFAQVLGLRRPDETIVVFTHGLFMQALLWLHQRPSEPASPEAMDSFNRFRKTVVVPNCAILRAAPDGCGQIELSPNMTGPSIATI